MLMTSVALKLKAYFRRTGYFLCTLPTGMLRREFCGYQDFICILQTLASTFLVSSTETYLALNCDVLFKESVSYVLSLDLNIFSRE